MSPTSLTQRILSFWFPKDLKIPVESHWLKKWFAGTPELDQEIQKEFGMDIESFLKNPQLIHQQTQDPKDILAMVILLDQFPRNIFRGTPKSFGGDALALSLSKSAIQQQLDLKLEPVERLFLYVPFEHSETLKDQEEGMSHFQSLLEHVQVHHPQHEQICAAFKKYSEEHCEIIKKYGRFPHRNAILGRESTQEELEYTGSHFGTKK